MMKNFMNKPITWGSIIKTCGAAMVVYTIIAGVCLRGSPIPLMS